MYPNEYIDARRVRRTALTRRITEERGKYVVERGSGWIECSRERKRSAAERKRENVERLAEWGCGGGGLWQA